MIIMLGLLVCGFVGVLFLIAGVPDNNRWQTFLGTLLVFLAVGTALTIVLTCDGGCQV